MPEKWTGKLVGKMHNERVSQQDIADEVGMSRTYVCMVLNGQKRSPVAEKRFNEAFEAILKKRKG